MKNFFKNITNWEAWPFKILYAPLVPFWAWNMIRSGAVWYFTPSNPKITFGGMEGEGKKEMYELLPRELYPETIFIQPGEDFAVVLSKIEGAGIQFPFIVKPDIASQGVLFRKIDNEQQLRQYHAAMKWEYIAQQLVTYPMEVSAFYIRHPLNEKGMVTGFLHKIPMHVTGNGKHTLEQLVLDHPKAKERYEQMRVKHEANWQSVVPMGEKYMLSHAGNHNRGARFVDLKDQIDDSLVAIFDRISHRNNDFFYGRYDILCAGVDDLKAGKNFSILEYNGCGAEPNHFYDTGYTLLGAYREILKHWKHLYRISKYNASKGVSPWPYNKGKVFLSNARKLFHEMKALDETLP